MLTPSSFVKKMLVKTVLLTLTLIVSGLAKYCLNGPCGLGHFFNNTSPYCFPCPNGFYMFLETHGCLSCFRCQKPRQDEDDISQCYSSSNVEISCKHGYFFGVDVTEERYCDVCNQCLATEKKDSPCDGRHGRHCTSNNSTLPQSDPPGDVTVTPKFENVTLVPEITSTNQIVHNSSTFDRGSKDGDGMSNAEYGLIVLGTIGVLILVIAGFRFLIRYYYRNCYARQPVPINDPENQSSASALLTRSASSNCTQMSSTDSGVCVELSQQ